MWVCGGSDETHLEVMSRLDRVWRKLLRVRVIINIYETESYTVVLIVRDIVCYFYVFPLKVTTLIPPWCKHFRRVKRGWSSRFCLLFFGRGFGCIVLGAGVHCKSFFDPLSVKRFGILHWYSSSRRTGCFLIVDTPSSLSFIISCWMMRCSLVFGLFNT